MTISSYCSKIRNLIFKDEIQVALVILRQLLSVSPKLDEAILQSGRFENIRQQIQHDTVSYVESNLSQNQIRVSLLDLLREIETQGEIPALLTEIERALSIISSKNGVVSSTISAAGDVHIGDEITIQQVEKIYNIDKIDNANFS